MCCLDVVEFFGCQDIVACIWKKVLLGACPKDDRILYGDVAPEGSERGSFVANGVKKNNNQERQQRPFQQAINCEAPVENSVEELICSTVDGWSSPAESNGASSLLYHLRFVPPEAQKISREQRYESTPAPEDASKNVVYRQIATPADLAEALEPFGPLLVAELSGDETRTVGHTTASAMFNVSCFLWDPVAHTIFLGLSDESYLSAFDAFLSNFRLPLEQAPPAVFRGRLSVWKTVPQFNNVWPTEATAVYIREFVSPITQLGLESSFLFVALSSGRMECFCVRSSTNAEFHISEHSSAQLGYLLPRHTMACTAFVFDADRKLLVTGSLDRSLRVFRFA